LHTFDKVTATTTKTVGVRHRKRRKRSRKRKAGWGRNEIKRGAAKWKRKRLFFKEI